MPKPPLAKVAAPNPWLALSPAGLGKTSLAMAIAERLERPVAVMVGNDWLDADDMIGKEVGENTTSVVDRYISRVRRSEQQMRYAWEHSILAEAMKKGHILIYDEFTRSSAKAHGILLSVLEEGILISTDQVNSRTTLRRVPLASGRAAHTAKEAAIDLVRLEFNAERIQLGIAQAEDRLRAYRAELDLIADKHARLTRLIAE